MNATRNVRKLTSKPRPVLAYRKRSGTYFSDPNAKAVYDRHMHVLGEAKHYFFLLYGSHDFLSDVMRRLVEAPDLDQIASALAAYQDGDSDGLKDIDPELAILVLEPKKKRSEGFISCKTNLLFCVICSLRCFRNLMRDDVQAALSDYGKSAYYLGGCIGIGTVLFGDESLSGLAKRAATKRHEPNRAARSWVMAEWMAHRLVYGNNKSAFARDYARRVRNEFDVSVTEKQIREVWLRDTLSAGNPAGVPAGGE